MVLRLLDYGLLICNHGSGPFLLGPGERMVFIVMALAILLCIALPAVAIVLFGILFFIGCWWPSEKPKPQSDKSYYYR